MKHFISTIEERERLGLDKILAECVCRSPQGRQLKSEERFYGPADYAKLQFEFAAIASLRSSLHALPYEWRTIETILGRFRNISQTLRSLAKGMILDESELFELKRCFSLLRQLAEANFATKAAKVIIREQADAEALLNPASGPTKGFHIYSSYSKELTEVRAEKTAIEHRIRLAEGDERRELLAERSLILDREREEEGRQLQRLSHALYEHIELLRNNLDAVALLDFRLARARLANKWQAPEPHIDPQMTNSNIVDAWHPLLRHDLESRGAGFTVQSIVLEEGATVISGLNMGGKSVALQTFLLCLYLVQLAYCPPCKEISTGLYDFFIYMADNPGTLKSGLSSFGMEAARLREYFRLLDQGRCLAVMDEPCRGTNPKEATAIVRAICRIYSETNSSLLLATHYDLMQEKKIVHYQIRGLPEFSNEDEHSFARSKRKSDSKTGSYQTLNSEDLAAVHRISEQMDYELVRIEDGAQIPAGAINIARLMGIDKEHLSLMRDAYNELHSNEHEQIKEEKKNKEN